MSRHQTSLQRGLCFPVVVSHEWEINLLFVCFRRIETLMGDTQEIT